jgi:hypothetical protein
MTVPLMLLDVTYTHLPVGTGCDCSTEVYSRILSSCRLVMPKTILSQREVIVWGDGIQIVFFIDHIRHVRSRAVCAKLRSASLTQYPQCQHTCASSGNRLQQGGTPSGHVLELSRFTQACCTESHARSMLANQIAAGLPILPKQMVDVIQHALIDSVRSLPSVTRQNGDATQQRFDLSWDVVGTNCRGEGAANAVLPQLNERSLLYRDKEFREYSTIRGCCRS